jgi:hypothetical protein
MAMSNSTGAAFSNGYIGDGPEMNDPLTNLNGGLSTNLFLGLNLLYARSTLQKELESNLGNELWRCFHHAAECRFVDISVDRAASIELSMVEGMESFEAKFERPAFC